MKIIYTLFVFMVVLLLSESIHAQTTFEFRYDASGNRLTRTVILLKSATINPDSLEAKKSIIPLDDQIGLQEMRIYPNPTKGLLKIELPGLADQMAIIRVYDSGGKQILQKIALSSANEIDLSSQPAGVYIMMIRIGQENKEWKIIKE